MLDICLCICLFLKELESNDIFFCGGLVPIDINFSEESFVMRDKNRNYSKINKHMKPFIFILTAIQHAWIGNVLLGFGGKEKLQC